MDISSFRRNSGCRCHFSVLSHLESAFQLHPFARSVNKENSPVVIWVLPNDFFFACALRSGHCTPWKKNITSLTIFYFWIPRPRWLYCITKREVKSAFKHCGQRRPLQYIPSSLGKKAEERIKGFPPTWESWPLDLPSIDIGNKSQ